MLLQIEPSAECERRMSTRQRAPSKSWRTSPSGSGRCQREAAARPRAGTMTRVTAAAAMPAANIGGGQLHIRRRKEKSTLILISIVLIFLVCHLSRLCISVSQRGENEISICPFRSFSFKSEIVIVSYLLFQSVPFTVIPSGKVSQ